MTKETLKEIGKFLTDLSKITVGVAFLTPFVKDNSINKCLIIGYWWVYTNK